MDTFIIKYGTRTTSQLLKKLAQQLRDLGSDVDMAVVNDIAADLETALVAYVNGELQ